MKTKTVFTGSACALITPFCDGKVDYDSLGAVIDFQLENGTDALVACGTTGESSTLTDDEHVAVIRYTVERAAGKVPVIAGTGSNDTAYAVWLSRQAQNVGADALLLVTPYYNKATPRGLVRHFSEIADSVSIPSVLYNVPSRTGCGIPLSVYRELAEHPNIAAVKEACGNISAIAELFAACGDKLDIYSGNDDQIVPILSLGGKGVISVLANVMPRETHDMCGAWFAGNTALAAKTQLDYLKLINSLFCEVNPVPVKTAMSMMGFCSGEMRLPLCDMDPANAQKLADTMREYGLI